MPSLLRLAFLLLLAAPAVALTISDAEARRAGQVLWKNECGGTVAGLTSWNRGEDFASLGIGHFIWYPAGRRGPFEESFPALVEFLASSGTALPAWLREARACPWNSREEFIAELNGPRLAELRRVLAATVPLQARFAARRLEAALPKLVAAASAGEQEAIRRRFESVGASPGGITALLDYVNFKGEGTLPTERYEGRGWGLLQVLEATPDGGNARSFGEAAARVLAERVRRAPPTRNEARWLPGWQSRVRAYGR